MPSLSHRRLHSRATIERALCCAGQLAHADPDEIAGHLNDLYDLNTRLAWARLRDDRANMAERAAPIALLKARETGLISGQHYDALAVNYVTHMAGTTCCLCLCIDMRQRCHYGAPRKFIMFVCPTFLRGEGTNVDHYPPLCSGCAHAIAGRIWRQCGNQQVEDEPALWASILAWLASNKTFRARVEQHAFNLRLLRFDPRRAPIANRKAA